MKALPPAPVRITPRISGSSRASSKTVRSSFQVCRLRALSTLGRFNVTYAMAPFFSYNRFSSIGDELIGLLPGKSERTEAAARIAASDEGAEPGDRLADNQVLHLVGALVGGEGLGIGEKARGVVVCDDAAAAKQLAPPGDRLAHPARAECLRQRRVLGSQFAVVVQLRQPRHQALAGRDVAQDLGQP